MLHTLSGYNFHGGYEIRVRAPKHGGQLTVRQSDRIDKALCGVSDCACGGGYGSGPDPGSATLEVDGYGNTYWLNPAPAPEA